MQRDGFPVSGRFAPRRFTPNFEPEDDSFHVQCMKWIRNLEAKRPQFRYLQCSKPLPKGDRSQLKQESCATWPID